MHSNNPTAHTEGQPSAEFKGLSVERRSSGFDCCQIDLESFDGVILDFDDLMVGTQQLSKNPGRHRDGYLRAIDIIVGTTLGMSCRTALVDHLVSTSSRNLLPGLRAILLEQLGGARWRDITVEALGKELERHRIEEYRSRATDGDFPVLEGVEDFVRALSRAGKTVGIYTSNRRAIVTAVMRTVLSSETQAAVSPEHLLCGDDVAKLGGERKPSPFGFVELSRRMKSPVSRLIAFDDSVEGLVGALDAGIKLAVGVDGGKGTDFSTLSSNFSDGQFIAVRSFSEVLLVSKTSSTCSKP